MHVGREDIIELGILSPWVLIQLLKESLGQHAADGDQPFLWIVIVAVTVKVFSLFDIVLPIKVGDLLVGNS